MSVFTITLNAQNDSLEVERLYKLGIDSLRVKTQKSIHNFEKAIQIINDSILTKETDNNYFLLKKALILDELSHYYRKDTDDVPSLKAIQESLKIKESIGETYTLSSTYRILGRLYRYKKDSIKALEYYKKALAQSKMYGNDKERVQTLSALSGYYLTYKDIEKSEMYAQQALKYGDSIGYNKGKSLAFLNFSNIEKRKKNYESAISYSNKNIELCEKTNDRISIERNYKVLGYCYRKMGQPEKAVFYYKKSLDLLIDIGIEGSIANRCLALSNAYTDLGNHERAFAFYRGYKRQQIKDMNIKSIKEFAELEAKYTYERQKTIDSIRLVEEQKINEEHLLQQASTRFWKITAIIVGVFGLIIAGIVFVSRKRKEQIRLGQLKNEMLQKEVDYKQKDISDFALNISRNRKWREELLAYIKKIKKSGSFKDDSNFKDLEKAVLEREIVDNNMVDIQSKVDVLNTAFYEKLHEKFPTLTKTEAKICSLIRLNIDNNEIALLQNVALESVYRSRSRLRKKLNLSSKDDLNTFLNQF
ncbi:tetratricopeptide repeat protein [uncultured Psychroserpens sp.]|uniref:tetratricopeptide repeat protein n=1 Tax=uncultured Psychroserpens sp. TaxID=255436 RepID=UPI00262B9220|nr:tetratricopeptide repeat protein [uncultured Psychroserpens sp.]